MEKQPFRRKFFAEGSAVRNGLAAVMIRARSIVLGIVLGIALGSLLTGSLLPVTVQAEETVPAQEGTLAMQTGMPSMQLGAVAAGQVAVDGTELKVYVAVQALPGMVGIDHVNLQFTNLQNDRTITKILRDRDYADGVYSGWLSMSIYEPAGTYVLDKVILQDENGAYVKYCRAEELEDNDKYLALPVTAAFQVSNGVGYLDETAPVLGAVVVSPTQAAKKSELRVAAAVADDFSGVDTVTVRFENENGKAVSLDLTADGELYTAVIEKSQTEEAGTYRVKRVTVTDHMGNSRVYRGGDGPFASDVFFVIQ